MDPSRIQLEDDRFGLIGVSFRPQNRATFVGADNGDYVWSIGVVVGEDDEIQTVEIDENGAKSSRMLTPGELFEGLQILGRHGPESFLIVGALTLLGMDLRASNDETAHQFAEVLRAAADDRSWRLPLHLIGQPRDLQLSTQGRDILRQTASALEREGHARTSLSAAQRLELSASALDSIRRRIARKSLQAYRMHGRWYVVLDNLTRSRASEQNGTHDATVPTAPPAAPSLSPFEEMPEHATEAETTAASESEAAEPFVTVEEESADQADQAAAVEEEAITEADVSATEQSEHPTEDDLAAFVSEEPEVEPQVETPAAAEVESEPEEEPLAAEAVAADELEGPEISDEMLASEAAAEEQAARDELAREAGLGAPPTFEPESEQPEPEPVPGAIDQLISESVMEQFLVVEIDTFIRELHPAGEQPSTEEAAAQPAAEEAPAQEPTVEAESEAVAAAETMDAEAETEIEAEPEQESLHDEEPGEEEIILTADEDAVRPEGVAAEADATEEIESAEGKLETATEEAVDSVVAGPSDDVEAESVVSETTKSAEEGDTEPLTPEPLDESGEPVAEMIESDEAAPAVPAPIDEESAGVIEEPVVAGPEEAPAELVAEPEQAVESDETVAEVGDSEEAVESDEVAAEAEESAESIESEEMVAGAGEPEERIEGEAFAEETVEEEAQETSEAQRRPLTAEEIDLLGHLREEVAFLRQQGQEKDRQIVAWINGGQWLQPFVDQIHSLEQQIERLGDQQTKRDNERIADLASERDRLRERLAQLESEITAARTPDPNARRSWFRRMMGSS